MIEDFFKYDASLFWEGLNEVDLNSRFVGADLSAFQRIEPVWDTGQDAMIFNQHNQEYLESCSLYICPSDRLYELIFLRRHYTFEHFWDNGNRNKFLRVIGHWLNGQVLSPAVLKPADNGRLIKLDGFHRLAIAFISGSKNIPFYCAFEELPDGISKAGA